MFNLLLCPNSLINVKLNKMILFLIHSFEGVGRYILYKLPHPQHIQEYVDSENDYLVVWRPSDIKCLADFDVVFV